MGTRRRRYFTATESAEIWDRWQRGEGLKLIGRVFGKTSSSIFAHLRPHGGIRPAVRRRSRRGLSLAGRGELARRALPGAGLGTRERAGRAQALHAGDRCGRLLLRSAKSLAARLQREHQRSAKAVLPQRDQSVSAQPGAVERGRQATQRTTAQNAGLRNTGG